jgi:tryptophan-rich sensory protein
MPHDPRRLPLASRPGFTRRHERGASAAAVATQLAPNLGWSYLFFGRRNISLALAEIALLDVSIGATIAAFRRGRRSAAVLLVPYSRRACLRPG